MRGQTTLDFAIGMSLFLAVIVFIFLFIPGLLSPFTTGAQSDTVTANRIADKVTKGMLGSSRRPYTLDEYCAVTFFNETSTASCDGWSGTGDVESQVGIDDTRQSLNVTVRGNITDSGTGRDILCWDRQDEQLIEAGDAGCSDNPSGLDDVVLTRGETPPQRNDASVTALRVVSLAGDDVTVYVEMW